MNMFVKKSSPKLLIFACISYTMILLNGCTCNNQKPDISNINLTINADRFERDLFGIDVQNAQTGVERLSRKYGNFFNLFSYQVTTLGSKDSIQLVKNYVSFLSDTNFRNIYTDCETQFGDFAKYNDELTSSFRNYAFYFPKKTIPNVVTLISGFSFPVICDSLTLGISLDMYLGPTYFYYGTLEPPLPNYLRSRMRKEFLVCDAMKGWAQSDYGIDEASARMIDFMIAQGRLIYFLEKILPETEDSIRTGYTAEQLDWCVANEARIWSFFVENKLMFSIDPNLMNKYVNDGPTTNGFPQESPGNIGQFIGWKIVQSYMKNHDELSLQQLMEQKDLLKIFNESNYKPKK